MKRTITGWMNPAQFADRIAQFTKKKKVIEDVPVTIIYDDGKPNIKTVYEWMFLSGITKEWAIYSCLLTEEEAAKEFGDEPHKKLREFSVEVEGE